MLLPAETLTMGKPMMIVDPISGQEQRNAELLLEKGVAVHLFEKADAFWKLRARMGDSRRRNSLNANARRLGRPNAVSAIVAAVLRQPLLPESACVAASGASFPVCGAGGICSAFGPGHTSPKTRPIVIQG